MVDLPARPRKTTTWKLSRQLSSAVRGRRSQVDLSRRIGYRSNRVHRWEAGECAPSAATFLALCQQQRIDVAGRSRAGTRRRCSIRCCAASPTRVAN